MLNKKLICIIATERDFDIMISDIIRLILEEKDDSRNYYYANLCLRWKNNKIVVSAKEDLHYMVRRFNPKDYISFDMLCLAIEDEYAIPLVFNFY